MSERDPQSLSDETARLNFDPSDSLRDALSYFYNEANQHKVNDLKLHSMEYFRLSVMPGNILKPFPYQEENTSKPSLASRISIYSAQQLRPIENHQMPMASYMAAANTRRNSLRLFMRILPSRDDMYHLSRLDDFDIRPTHNSIDVYAEIYPLQRVIGGSALYAAGVNLNRTLRVGEHGGSNYYSEHTAADPRTLFARRPQLQLRNELAAVNPPRHESQPDPQPDPRNYV